MKKEDGAAMYTVKELADLSGVSPRTLRFYDQKGLLKPSSYTGSGYRLYDRDKVDMLQSILFFRELGFELEDIRKAVYSESFDRVGALESHLEQLNRKKERLEMLITNVKRSIRAGRGETEMSDRDKFEGFKEKLIRENEEKYGEEIRGKYGDKTIDDSNALLKMMSEEDYNEMNRLGEELQLLLESAVKCGDSPEGDAGKRAAELHKSWLGYTWKEYSPEAHRGLAAMYVEDERFTAYYDRNIQGCAEFLCKAVNAWTEYSDPQ